MEKIVDYSQNKTPLEYQITEYDCGTTSLLNALRYLFNRGEISPEIYKYILHHTLDICNESGEIGKGGTSIDALTYLSTWLDEDDANKHMNLFSRNIPKDKISIYNNELENKIKNGAVAILRVYQECEHYCLLTQLDKEFAYIFDPYYLPYGTYDDDDLIQMVEDKPFEYNRIVKKSRLDERSLEDFALVHGKNAYIAIIERKK